MRIAYDRLHAIYNTRPIPDFAAPSRSIKTNDTNLHRLQVITHTIEKKRKEKTFRTRQDLHATAQNLRVGNSMMNINNHNVLKKKNGANPYLQLQLGLGCYIPKILPYRRSHVRPKTPIVFLELLMTLCYPLTL